MSMLRKTKVLFGTDQGNFGTLCAYELNDARYETNVIHRDWRLILEAIHLMRPDVIVLGMHTNGINAYGFMEMVRYMVGYHPKFIVLSETGNWAIKEKVLSFGASFYFPELIPTDVLCQCIEELAHRATPRDVQETAQSLEQIASALLIELKISPSHKGYHYLRMALLALYEDPCMIHAVTKRLYPTIANRFDSNVVSVERAIRNAIASSWSLLDADMMEQYFSSNTKPTNSRYIASVLELLRARDTIQTQTYALS